MNFGKRLTTIRTQSVKFYQPWSRKQYETVKVMVWGSHFKKGANRIVVSTPRNDFRFDLTQSQARQLADQLHDTCDELETEIERRVRESRNDS